MIRMLGADMASGPDKAVLAFIGPKGVELVIDRDTLNNKNASRKADREYIAGVLINIAEKYGAQVERRDDGPNPGFRGASITLGFTLNGVGAMIDINNLHGGDHALIHWYNTEEYPARNFTSRFCGVVGSHSHSRPHHKATSCPNDWFALAMMLDGGLCLANQGSAFDP